ncbi:type II secretion system F family protein [Roseicyclus persicicus]|uniref:Type II secretion system F family protein n=1 Tax=Roseicyclus persicicus TaxID=2650661 RepID=A0A7X6GZN3_9RHOB|nr:type II secretion system F family protein [Roseibacterium persicicum]NKX44186.1 type II secretion system F family protein [Roseibacterium persicicum]
MDFLTSLFDDANAFLVAQLGEMGPLIVAGGLGLLLIIVALPSMLFRKKDPLDKIKAMRLGTDVSETPHALRRGGKDERLNRFAQYLEPQNQAEYSAAQMTLVRAGYRSKGAVQTFHFAQFALGIGGLLLGTLFVILSGGGTAQSSIMTVLIPGAVGYYAPKYWVQRRVQSREGEITAGFPDALDLMLVCVEAGQSLDQAIIRVAKEIRAGYPALSEEFEIVAYEMKAGKDKSRVLRDMGERVGIQDVNSFVTTLIQSATFGTSIAEALRVYADEMRDKRVMRAEEKANKLPTKLTLGTMMFCLPPLLIILIGPSVYGIAQNLSGGVGP